MNTEKNVLEIPIEDIIPNRFQPRLTFNEEGLNELSESIKQHGIIQPLVVRKLGDKYEIIAGERRYKAATQAGLSKVPVIISELDDNKSAEVALVENIQRRNLTAIEEAKSYKNLLDRGYLTQEQLATKMGVSQSTIANKLRLLNLDEEVQDALLNEKISERHARALLSIEDAEEQKKWLNRIINERMTVRQLDMELKKVKDTNGDEEGGIPLVNIDPDIDNIINTAEDINTTREVHDVASMLIPNENQEQVELEPTNEPITTVEQPQNQSVPNKFFNFLEDEQANMDMGNPEEDIFTFNPANLTSFDEPQKMNDEPDTPQAQDSLMDDLDSLLSSSPVSTEPVSENNNIVEVENNPVPEQTVENQQEEIDPFQQIFFPNSEINNEPIVEENKVNVIEEVPTINTENLIDPMDSVITLDPNYEEKQEEEAGTDLKSVINVIRETIDGLNQKGCNLEIEEIDLDTSYNINIKINKD